MEVYYDPKLDLLCAEPYSRFSIPKFKEDTDYLNFLALSGAKIGTTLRCDVEDAEYAKISCIDHDTFLYGYYYKHLSTAVVVDRDSFIKAVDLARKSPLPVLSSPNLKLDYWRRVWNRVQLDLKDGLCTAERCEAVKAQWRRALDEFGRALLQQSDNIDVPPPLEADPSAN